MKRFFVLSVALLSLAACSTSGEKTDNPEAKPTMADAEKKMNDAKTDMKEAATTAGSKSSCTLDKDTRVIEVKKTEAGGCELFYTKFGEAKSVASSGFGSQYCEEVKDRIQTNLNKAGFTCK